jgi:hypothetical protein
MNSSRKTGKRMSKAMATRTLMFDDVFRLPAVSARIIPTGKKTRA